MPAFLGLGFTTGSFAERVALLSPSLGQVFYQTDTDEYLKFVTDLDGVNRWLQMDVKSGRNFVINGGFNVWQRGSSFASAAMGASAVTASYYGPDRWQTLRTSVVAGATFSRISNPGASGFAYALRLQRDSGNAATQNLEMYTSFESANVVRCQGKYLCLSFWARCGANYSPSGSSMAVTVGTGTGTDGTMMSGFTSRANPINVSPTVTTSWQRFVFVTSAVMDTNITQLGIQLAMIPVGTAGANDWLEVTGVQLESGTAASDFEHIPFDVELKRCERYYESSYGYGTAPITSSGAGNTASLEGSGLHQYLNFTNNQPISIVFKTMKRRIPAVTHYSYNGVAGRYSYRDNAADNVGVVTYARISPAGIGVLLNSGANWSVGGQLWIGFVATAEL